MKSRLDRMRMASKNKKPVAKTTSSKSTNLSPLRTVHKRQLRQKPKRKPKILYSSKPIEKQSTEPESVNSFLQTDELEDIQETKQVHLRQLAGQLLIAVLCGYFIFLTYGVIVTNYSYTDNGTIAPSIMSVSDIRQKQEYLVVLEQYENCRLLYEDILLLDYRVSQGREDPIAIAPFYMALLEDKKNIHDVSDLDIKIKGMDIPAKYASVQNMMLSWVSSDVAEYLQLMNDGLSLKNTDILNQAMQMQTVLYDDFSVVTENMVILGESLHGVDMTDIKQWSPESYIDSYING